MAIVKTLLSISRLKGRAPCSTTEHAQPMCMQQTPRTCVTVNARLSSSRLDGRLRLRLQSSHSASCSLMNAALPSPKGARMPRARQACHGGIQTEG